MNPCQACGFDLWLPLAHLRVSALGLYDDNRFPGRSILALSSHAEHLEDLEKDVAEAFLADATDAGAAIRKVVGADRMNYAVLGNAVPHLHWHIIPRVGHSDPLPHKSPWSRLDRATPLPKQARGSLMTDIRLALSDETGHQ